MSPVIGVGPRCRRCHKRPVWADALCNPCWRLNSAFGHHAADLASEVDQGDFALEILDATCIEFERQLVAWLAGTDAATPEPG